MKPIIFKEATKILQKPQDMTEVCSSINIYTDGTQCISCWQPTWKEILSIIWYRKIWCSLRSGETQPPMWLIGSKTAFENKETK